MKNNQKLQFTRKLSEYFYRIRESSINFTVVKISTHGWACIKNTIHLFLLWLLSGSLLKYGTNFFHSPEKYEKSYSDLGIPDFLDICLLFYCDSLISRTCQRNYYTIHNTVEFIA